MSEKKFIGADEIPTNDIQHPQPQSGSESQTKPVQDGLGSGSIKTEYTDVNDTVVTVTDPCPVIILFGAKTSGKTMTLVRLTRYLEANGYQIKPDPLFRPSEDEDYKEMCSNYLKKCHSKYAADSTADMRFMLVKVLDKIGRPVCQLLEAPGEHYFDPKDPTKDFNTYIHNIFNIPNRRTWMFIVELDWQDPEIRAAYVTRIRHLPALVKRDKIIFTCHKIDRHNELTLSNGRPNTPQIFKNLKGQYPGLFEHFQNTNPITRLFKRYKFSFVPFSAGSFTINDKKQQVYTQGDDFYPHILWKAILKTVRG